MRTRLQVAYGWALGTFQDFHISNSINSEIGNDEKRTDAQCQPHSFLPITTNPETPVRTPSACHGHTVSAGSLAALHGSHRHRHTSCLPSPSPVWLVPGNREANAFPSSTSAPGACLQSRWERVRIQWVLHLLGI